MKSILLMLVLGLISNSNFIYANNNEVDNKSLIVASSVGNTIEVLNFQLFNPPIYLKDGEIVGQEYLANDFTWLDSYGALNRCNKLSYDDLLSYFTESYKKLVPKEAYDNLKSRKESLETIRYVFQCRYKGDDFLFIGSANGHLKDTLPDSWGACVFKLEDEKWKWYGVNPKDYDGSNLIFILPLNNPKKLKALIDCKVWNLPRFNNDFKNTLQNTNKLITPK